MLATQSRGASRHYRQRSSRMATCRRTTSARSRSGRRSTRPGAAERRDQGGMDLRRYELATLAAARRLRSSYCSPRARHGAHRAFDEPVLEIAHRPERGRARRGRPRRDGSRRAGRRRRDLDRGRRPAAAPRPRAVGRRRSWTSSSPPPRAASSRRRSTRSASSRTRATASSSPSCARCSSSAARSPRTRRPQSSRVRQNPARRVGPESGADPWPVAQLAVAHTALTTYVCEVTRSPLSTRKSTPDPSRSRTPAPGARGHCGRRPERSRALSCRRDTRRIARPPRSPGPFALRG